MRVIAAMGSATQTAVADHGTNFTAIFISVGIPLVVLGSIAMIVVAYFRLQAHRADAVALAHYRKLAEDAVANQEQLRTELSKLTEKVAAVEKLMRDVG
jgi:hypothetical protein